MAKKTVDPIKAKQAKQKKIAIAGGVLFVLLLAFQGPKLMKALHGGGGGGADWRTADAAAAAPATAPTGLVAPTLSGTPTVAATTTDEGPLSSEKPPTAAVGQLASLDDTFTSKDPFATQTPTTAPKAGGPPTPPTPPTPASSGGTGSAGGSDGGSAGAGSSAGGSSGSPDARTSAVIAVNGVEELVTVGGDFPSAQPTFHLKSLTAHSAQVTIAGGKYADGSAALTLVEGKAVTLMNQADGTRYKLQLFPEGTKAPAPAGGTTTSAGTPVIPAAPAATTSAATSAATTTAKTTSP
jgi:hypothetical protein